MMEAILPYLLTGVVSGVLAGLLGIGGGLVIVPALTFLLASHNTEHVMHVAIGTSLAVVTVTALSSTRAHHLRGTVRWSIWARLSPGLFIGTLTGALIADQLRGETLRLFFAVFELLVALQLMFKLQAKPVTQCPKTFVVAGVSLVIGIICAFVGVGGGIIIVPLLVWLCIPMKEAISTSAACGLPIALAGTLGFMLTGLDVNTQLPAWSTGYIYWPAFLGISITSVLFAPLGAKMAHALPANVLRQVFAMFILLLAILMFVGRH